MKVNLQFNRIGAVGGGIILCAADVFNLEFVFWTMIYLNDANLKPLQVVLREILIQSGAESMAGQGGATSAYAEGMKYAVIIIATVSILCIYPYIQKYFVKGVTIGAVKG